MVNEDWSSTEQVPTLGRVAFWMGQDGVDTKISAICSDGRRGSIDYVADMSLDRVKLDLIIHLLGQELPDPKHLFVSEHHMVIASNLEEVHNLERRHQLSNGTGATKWDKWNETRPVMTVFADEKTAVPGRDCPPDAQIRMDDDGHPQVMALARQWCAWVAKPTLFLTSGV